jgi:catechol 2,3-dioxygenase-like lactoylglutathione lyase family enzyme
LHRPLGCIAITIIGHKQSLGNVETETEPLAFIDKGLWLSKEKTGFSKKNPGIRPSRWAMRMFKETHPILGTRALEKSLDFYIQRLGFALAFRDPSGPSNYAGVRRDEVELHFQWQDESKMTTTRLRFLVEDPDALFAEYLDKQVFHDRTRLADTPWGKARIRVVRSGRERPDFLQRPEKVGSPKLIASKECEREEPAVFAPALQGYFLRFLPVAFFLADGLTAVFLADAFLADAFLAGAFLAGDALAVAFLAAGAAALLPRPLVNADSQPSEYFFVAPTRTIVTVVSLESFLFLHDVRPPWSTPPLQLP